MEGEVKIGKVKAPVQKTPKTVIEAVDATELLHILDEHEHVAVLFYSSLDKAAVPNQAYNEHYTNIVLFLFFHIK